MFSYYLPFFESVSINETLNICTSISGIRGSNSDTDVLGVFFCRCRVCLKQCQHQHNKRYLSSLIYRLALTMQRLPVYDSVRNDMDADAGAEIGVNSDAINGGSEHSPLLKRALPANKRPSETYGCSQDSSCKTVRFQVVVWYIGPIGTIMSTYFTMC